MITSDPTSIKIGKQSSERRDQEMVSVVIPCYNEERFIDKALRQLADQYDAKYYEIIVVDGQSEDRTREVIAQFMSEHPQLSVFVVENPARNIPTALNLGVATARGNIVARMDAHAVPSSGYVRRCVEVLQKSDVGVVGMPCHVQPGANTLMAKAVAQAVSHSFGIGDASYRLQKGGALQESVDTVAFACFRKELWVELGGFDESLLTNEDYDFNYRVRRSGREVLLDRSGHCDYFARSTLKGLAAQYLRYGGWKAEMVRRRPGSIKLRHLVAPTFVISLVVLSLLGFFWQVGWWLLAVELVFYFSIALFAGSQATRKAKESWAMIMLMPVVFATIHLTWGSSFLLSLSGLRSKP
ncbi:MAG: glycosyltransferase family 2 protein [Acidobacteria bacterium]|nr:MAG: glycosyltransferase family 2 protein [Acidobacteriota bacterium]